ncbi:hypothetical protein DK37_02300 [Halomonas sp. SUBG004]|nr:hypothetical protein DK37_02300 [Halomonas sp. SUBG004]
MKKTRAQIDKLKDLKTGMMQELLAKGIGHTEFKDSPVGLIPMNWEVSPLISICNRITDGTHQAVKNFGLWQNSISLCVMYSKWRNFYGVRLQP